MKHEAFDPAALETLVRAAIAGQKWPEDRATLSDAVDAGEVEVFQPDPDGYVAVAVGGHRILRVHASRVARG